MPLGGRALGRRQVGVVPRDQRPPGAPREVGVLDRQAEIRPAGPVVLGDRGRGQPEQGGCRRTREPVAVAKHEYGTAYRGVSFADVLPVPHTAGVPVQRGDHCTAVRATAVGESGVDRCTDRPGGRPRMTGPGVGQRVQGRAQPPMQLSSRAASSAPRPSDEAVGLGIREQQDSRRAHVGSSIRTAT